MDTRLVPINSEPRVHGKFIQGGELVSLPKHRCVKCGSNEPGGITRHEALFWFNPLIYLSFFISGLITLLLYYGTRKKVEVDYYLCPKCADNRKVGNITTALTGVVSIIGLAATISNPGVGFAVFLCAFFVSLFGRLVWLRSPLRAVSHQGGEFLLAGASKEVRAACSMRKQLE